MRLVPSVEQSGGGVVAGSRDATGQPADGGGPTEPEDAGAVPGPGNGAALQHVPVLRPRPEGVHDA